MTVTRKLRELRREVVRLQRRAVQRTRRAVVCGQFHQVPLAKTAKARRQEARAAAVERRMAGLAEAVAWGGAR